MQPNAFIGKSDKPTDTELAQALGITKSLWDQLLAGLSEDHGIDTQEWKSYSIKTGWALRLVRKKRTIVWMAPHQGSFQVMFILGDKAIKALRPIKLSARTMKIIAEAPRYPEGTGIRLTVKSPRDLSDIDKLVVVKLAN